MTAVHTLASCQRRVVKLYRARAYEALARAQQAHQYSQLVAARGYLDKACFWHAASHDWNRKVRKKLPSLMCRQAE